MEHTKKLKVVIADAEMAEAFTDCLDHDDARNDEFDKLTDLFIDESKGRPFIDYYSPARECNGETPTSPLPPYATETPSHGTLAFEKELPAGEDDGMVIEDGVAYRRIRTRDQLDRLRVRPAAHGPGKRCIECL